MAADPSAHPRPIPWTALLLALALLVGLAACGRKPAVQSRAAELERAFQGTAPNAWVALALSAVRTNNYAVGVVALETAERVPGQTPAQLMAIQRTMEAITADLVTRAAQGDPNAKADLAAIERTRSQ